MKVRLDSNFVLKMIFNLIRILTGGDILERFVEKKEGYGGDQYDAHD